MLIIFLPKEISGFKYLTLIEILTYNSLVLLTTEIANLYANVLDN
jgi:hypothetical protein